MLVLVGCAPQIRDYGGITLVAGDTPRNLAAEDVAQRLADSTAVIRTDTGRAFAFFIDDKGHLITNRHVIEDARDIQVSRLVAGGTLDLGHARVVYVDGVRDLALLQVDGAAGLEPLSLATAQVRPIAEFIDTGQAVMVLDYQHEKSEAGPGVVIEVGRIRRPNVHEPAAGPGAFVELAVDIDRGQSGGAVVDRYGRVLGVVTWTWRDEIGGYAIPVSAVVRSLAQRPDLTSAARRETRLRERVGAFAQALQRGAHREMERFVSPRHARHVRERVLSALWASMEHHSNAMERFFGQLEFSLRKSSVDAVVAQLEAPPGVGTMWGGSRPLPIPMAEADSFLQRFGLGYVKARVTGTRSPRKAMEAAARDLRSLATARHMATATWIAELGGTQLSVGEIVEMPSLYGPMALVTAHVVDPGIAGQSAVGGVRRVALQMRVEWGDWYVAGVQELDATSGWLSLRDESTDPGRQAHYTLPGLPGFPPMRKSPGER